MHGLRVAYENLSVQDLLKKTDSFCGRAEKELEKRFWGQKEKLTLT